MKIVNSYIKLLLLTLMFMGSSLWAYEEADYFVSQWQVTDGETLAFPIDKKNANEFPIDWGDGTVETFTDDNPSHTYATAGTYTIKTIIDDASSANYVEATFSPIGNQKIVGITQWGLSGVRYLGDPSDGASTFYGCSNLEISATDSSNITFYGYKANRAFNGQHHNKPIKAIHSGFENATFYAGPVTSLRPTTTAGMFQGIETITDNFSGWNTLYITDMSAMFKDSGMTGDISLWNVSNVAKMSNMFENSSFNGDISSWTTSSLDNAQYMFAGIDNKFNQVINLSVVSNANLSNMFYSNPVFNSNITITGAPQNTYNMLSNATAFNSTVSISDTSKIVTMQSMFDSATSFNQPINFDLPEALTLERMFYNTASFNNSVTLNIPKVTTLEETFARTPIFDTLMSMTNTGAVTTMEGMFSGVASTSKTK